MGITTGTCPYCGRPLDIVGSVGIIHADGDWEAETERFRCDSGHMLFGLDTEATAYVDEEEEAAANEANNYGYDDNNHDDTEDDEDDTNT